MSFLHLRRCVFPIAAGGKRSNGFKGLFIRIEAEKFIAEMHGKIEFTVFPRCPMSDHPMQGPAVQFFFFAGGDAEIFYFQRIGVDPPDVAAAAGSVNAVFMIRIDPERTHFGDLSQIHDGEIVQVDPVQIAFEKSGAEIGVMLCIITAAVNGIVLYGDAQIFHAAVCRIIDEHAGTLIGFMDMLVHRVKEPAGVDRCSGGRVSRH